MCNFESLVEAVKLRNLKSDKVFQLTFGENEMNTMPYKLINFERLKVVFLKKKYRYLLSRVKNNEKSVLARCINLPVTS